MPAKRFLYPVMISSASPFEQPSLRARPNAVMP